MPEQIKKRFIKRDELSFEVTVYPDSENPEEDLSLGHVLLSGITERLDRDDNTAWLEVVVKADAWKRDGKYQPGSEIYWKYIKLSETFDTRGSVLCFNDSDWRS